MDTQRLRVRRLLASYRWLVIGICLLAVVGGAWVTYGTYVDPGEETHQQLEDSWTTTGVLTHSAVVEAENTVYPVGSRLSNQPLYYTRLSPTLEGEFDAGYRGTTGDDVSVDLEVTLRWESSDDEHTYWRETETLATASESGLDPDESATAAFEFNVSEIENRMDAIESDLGASPGDRQVILEIEREIEGTVDGTQRSTTETTTIDVDLDGNTYSLTEDGSFGETYEQYETVTQTRTYGLERRAGGPLLALVGLVGAIGLTVVPPSRYELSPAEAEWLAYRETLEEQGSLVTRTRLPADDATEPTPGDDTTEMGRKQQAPLESLEAAIQLAIDLEAPILEDVDRDRYVVLTDDLWYVYEPPSPPHEGGQTNALDGGRDDAPEPADSGTVTSFDESIPDAATRTKESDGKTNESPKETGESDPKTETVTDRK